MISSSVASILAATADESAAFDIAIAGAICQQKSSPHLHVHSGNGPFSCWESDDICCRFNTRLTVDEVDNLCMALGWHPQQRPLGSKLQHCYRHR